MAEVLQREAALAGKPQQEVAVAGKPQQYAAVSEVLQRKAAVAKSVKISAYIHGVLIFPFLQYCQLF